jgi:hypothetical protein
MDVYNLFFIFTSASQYYLPVWKQHCARSVKRERFFKVLCFAGVLNFILSRVFSVLSFSKLVLEIRRTKLREKIQLIKVTKLKKVNNFLTRKGRETCTTLILHLAQQAQT